LPAAKRRTALAMALSTKLEEGNIVVLDSLKFKEAKTKAFAEVLDVLAAGRKPLVLDNFADANAALACRNVAGLTHMQTQDINAYEVLNSSKVIFTKDAVKTLTETFAKEAN
jgi:large subunit ribosomal protein L4